MTVPVWLVTTGQGRAYLVPAAEKRHAELVAIGLERRIAHGIWLPATRTRLATANDIAAFRSGAEVMPEWLPEPVSETDPALF